MTQETDIQATEQTTNGHGSQTATTTEIPSEINEPAPPPAQAPPSPPTLRFSREEYLTTGSVLIEVQRTGEMAGNVRVYFTAREESATVDGYLDRRELVFIDGEDSHSFSLRVQPNFSSAPERIDLALTNPENAQLGTPHQAVVVVEPLTGNADYFKSLVLPITANPNVGRVFRHVLLGLVLIGSIFLLDMGVGAYADSHAKKWDQYLNPLNKPDLVFLNDSPVKIKAYEQDRLKDQLARIRYKEDLHRELMEFYYRGYYMGIIVLSFTAALAAIMLMLISKRGWAATSEYVITTFIIMTCASLFYGSWAGLFKQEENITTNKVLYLKYSALENELLSYVTTGEALNYNFNSLSEVKPEPTPSATSSENSKTQAGNKTEGAKTDSSSPPEQSKKPETQAASAKIGIKLDIPDFIHYVDLQLAQDNIAIGFDYSQIPNYKNAFSNVGTTK